MGIYMDMTGVRLVVTNKCQRGRRIRGANMWPAKAQGRLESNEAPAATAAMQGQQRHSTGTCPPLLLSSSPQQCARAHPPPPSSPPPSGQARGCLEAVRVASINNNQTRKVKTALPLWRDGCLPRYSTYNAIKIQQRKT
ncbi:hypothetical protein A9K55_004570 [Cordyceps militaris]|uniref:Uncharacterized protein n=1 Tax=Cordyceps militaris TaxID=73501 RepID=A0A2H4SPM7_CORMI|nr:hypothetical protein A9K55_004570 [Cordyceps militaris]